MIKTLLLDLFYIFFKQNVIVAKAMHNESPSEVPPSFIRDTTFHVLKSQIWTVRLIYCPCYHAANFYVCECECLNPRSYISQHHSAEPAHFWSPCCIFAWNTQFQLHKQLHCMVQKITYQRTARFLDASASQFNPLEGRSQEFIDPDESLQISVRIILSAQSLRFRSAYERKRIDETLQNEFYGMLTSVRSAQSEQ